MKTTLNKIREHNPCESSWKALLKHLKKTSSDDEPLELTAILKANGIRDAIWCLRCFDYRDYCLFLADVAESVLYIYEKKYTGNKAPRQAIKAIRHYHAGEINKDELIVFASAAAAADAASAASYAADAAAYAAYAASVTDAASAAYAAAAADVASAASYAADAAAYAASYADVTYAVSASSAAYIAYTADTATASDASFVASSAAWKKTEALFIKHFN